MHNTKNREPVFKLLGRVANHRSPQFTGVGVVFYHQLEALRFAPLEVQHREAVLLPVKGTNEIASMLVKFAEMDSPWHDGFHFVEFSTMTLTHLAQFISPPIPTIESLLPKATGARHMAAALACRVEGIVAVGLVTRTGDPSIYSHINLSGA